MPSRRSVLMAASSLLSPLAAAAQTRLPPPYPFPLPRELDLPISFVWSGPLVGAAGALAARLGYGAWANMSSGLPMPDPPPVVPVSVGFAAATPAEIVEALNRVVASRAVVVLDPAQRSIGVVFCG